MDIWNPPCLPHAYPYLSHSVFKLVHLGPPGSHVPILCEAGGWASTEAFLPPPPHPRLLNRMTDTTENITFPQLRWRVVIDCRHLTLLI